MTGIILRECISLVKGRQRYSHISRTRSSFSENFGPMGLFDALLGTGKRFHSVMREGMTRHAGQPDKAREELLHQLASWEAEVDVSSSLAPLSSRL